MGRARQCGSRPREADLMGQMGAHRHSTRVSHGIGGDASSGGRAASWGGVGGLIRNFLTLVIGRCFIPSILYCSSSSALLILVLNIQFTDCWLIMSH